ncbi:hypothetical protein IE987_02735 [Klebsiella pneumoniae]|uniref:Uncharacterized protein n=1 Tax=Klebsiella pneumoniae TaxID=573 RepID=A0A927DNL0_KLEPN|nr:hypothetical protein [Klebsiella pneumoniae]
MLGAAIIRYDKVSDHFWTGLLLVQLSNLCFAIGMVGYKRLMEVRPMPQHNAFAPVLCRGLYRGGGGVVYARQRPEAADHHAAVERAGVARRGGFRAGLLYVELWRHPVDAGTLGIMNNVHVPAGLLVNLAIWQEQPHWPSFISGALVILGLAVGPSPLGRSALGQTADDRRRGSAQSE